MSVYRNRSNGGFLLIMLMAVIAVGVIFYLNMAGGGTGGKFSSDAGSSDDTSSKPWDFEDSIGSGLDVPLNDSQLHTTKTMELYTSVMDTETNQRRGRVDIFLEPDGTVNAGWSGSYKKSKDVQYEVTAATAKGNVDPSIVYEDLDGKEDRSLLYFIAKGKFGLMRTQNGRISLPGGELFITGFFRPDGTYFGNIHLTSDRVKQTVFTFGKEYRDEKK